jgi:hypothetical protein
MTVTASLAQLVNHIPGCGCQSHAFTQQGHSLGLLSIDQAGDAKDCALFLEAATVCHNHILRLHEGEESGVIADGVHEVQAREKFILTLPIRVRHHRDLAIILLYCILRERFEQFLCAPARIFAAVARNQHPLGAIRKQNIIYRIPHDKNVAQNTLCQQVFTLRKARGEVESGNPGYDLPKLLFGPGIPGISAHSSLYMRYWYVLEVGCESASIRCGVISVDYDEIWVCIEAFNSKKSYNTTYIPCERTLPIDSWTSGVYFFPALRLNVPSLAAPPDRNVQIRGAQGKNQGPHLDNVWPRPNCHKYFLPNTFRHFRPRLAHCPIPLI